MARASVFFSCIFVLLLALAGCQEPGKKIENPVEVHIEGGDEFPDSLAGTWRNSKRGWEIVFEPDGTISSVVHTIGRVRLRPGEVEKKPLIREGQGVYEPGQWMVQYDAIANELAVEILLDHFRAQSGVSIVSGHSRDLFIGPVAEDGKSWSPEWYSYPTYFITTDIHKDFKIEEPPEMNPKETLTFTKVEESE
jgi:hypothetical protein